MFESVNIQPMTNPSVDQNTPSSNQRMEKLPPKVSQQPRFLSPPQHHTPDSVLHLLSSVLPLLSVNFLMTAALSSSIFPSLLCSYFFRSFAHFQQIPRSWGRVWWTKSTQESTQKSAQKSAQMKKCSKKYSKKRSKKCSNEKVLKEVLKKVLKKVLK